MEKQYRYPGTRPFQEDDRNLFFGRNEDIEKLTELIVLEKMVVLFSKSGYGKSSLLNAGVIPRLKEVENFQTLSIRLNDPERNPVELLGFHLENKIEQSCFLNSKFNIPVELSDDISAKLWYYAKSIPLAQGDFREFVLIFDQFEELFNYSPDQVKDFASELATLLNPNLITSLRGLFKQKIAVARDYFTKEETDLLLEPLNLKVVFSLRSDRISLLNQLKDSIPAVFKKTYELQPLNESQARDALLEPAGKEGDFISPKFSFSMDAQDGILSSLLDKEKRRIETFQLQLICQHAEELIIQKQKANATATKIELSKAELGNPEDIFENHYNTIITSLPAVSQLKAKILIEDKLIIGGNRVPLPESVIIEEHHVPEDLLKILVDKRLLRSEPNTVGGISFELSHDTLVAPIQKTAKIRRSKEAEAVKKQKDIELAKIKERLHAEEMLRKKADIALEEAKIQTQNSQSLTFAAFANEQLTKNLTLAIRLAELAWQNAPTKPPSPPIQRIVARAFYEAQEKKSFFYIENLYHQDYVTSVAFSPDGNKILTASLDRTTKIWDADSGKLIAELIGHYNYVNSAVFSPDGKKIITTSGDNTAKVWEADSGNLIATLIGHSGAVFSATFSPNGKKIVTASSDSTAKVWEADSGNFVSDLIGHLESVTSAAFSPDGNKIVTASSDSTAKIWEVASGKLLKGLVGHSVAVSSAAFSPDGNKIFTISTDGSAKIWEVASGNLLADLKGNLNRISVASFSPDGKKIVTTSDDNSAKIWEVASGKLIKGLVGHSVAVSSAAFSPDGNKIFTISADGTAKIWEVASGNLLADLVGRLNSINIAAFSPDGKKIVTASNDNSAKIWLTPEAIIECLKTSDIYKPTQKDLEDLGIDFIEINE